MNVSRRTTSAQVVSLTVLILAAPLAGVGCATRQGGPRAAPAAEAAMPNKAFVRALPDTEEYVRLLAAPDSAALRSGLVTLKPGADCGWHSTENYEELVICLAGEGEIEVEGVGRTRLAAGCYAYNPPRTRHNIFNGSQQLLRYIYVVAPVGGRGRP